MRSGNVRRAEETMRFISGLLLALIIFIPTVVFADTEQEQLPKEEKGGVEWSLSGYYRVRFFNNFNQGWKVGDAGSNWQQYFDQRAELNPKLTINEKISINMQLDLLRNITFGQNQIVTKDVLLVDRDPNDTEKIRNIQIGTINLPQGNVLSQNVSSTNLLGQDVPTIQVNRLWGDVLLPVGRLMIGRQSYNFGMGLLSNDGNGLDSDYGDTYDRILWAMKIGKYVIPALSFDKVVEGSTWQAYMDVNQYSLICLVKDVKWSKSNQFDGGADLIFRTQTSTDANLFIYDLWLKFQFGGFLLENEDVAIQGSMVMFNHDEVDQIKQQLGKDLVGVGGGKIEANAYLSATRFKYQSDLWSAGVEYGFSSPSDANPNREFDPDQASKIAFAQAKLKADPDNTQRQNDFINAVLNNQSAFGKKVYTFPFDKDYIVDLILWRQLMGGAVKNAMYAKASGSVSPIEELKIGVDVIDSYINESGKGKDTKDAHHDLGWEMDYNLTLKAAQHFTCRFDFGYLFAGQYFRDVYDNVKNIYTFQVRTIFDF